MAEPPELGSLTVIYREGDRTIAWELPSVRDFAFETRDEHERDISFFQLGRPQPPPPPKVLTWSSVPLKSGPDSHLYTVTIDPPPTQEAGS